MILGLKARKRLKVFFTEFVYSLALGTLILLSINLFTPIQNILFTNADLETVFLFEVNRNNPIGMLFKIFFDLIGSLSFRNSIMIKLILVSLIIYPILLIPALKKLKKLEKGVLLRGREFVKDTKEFNKKIIKEAQEGAKKLEKSIGKKLPDFYTPRLYLSESSIPFFRSSETTAILFLGAAGAGKTNAFFDYIEKFEEWDKKHERGHFLCIYDMKHDFWKKLYREDIDFLFYPKDRRTLKWNWFDEFVDITLILRDKTSNEEIKKIEVGSIGEGEKIYEAFKDRYSIEVIKKIQGGFFANFLDSITTEPKDESSKVWHKKGKDTFEAVLCTVVYDSLFPSPKGLIDFHNMFNTRDLLVERLLELDFARKYRSISIEALIGSLDKPSEAGVNTYENYSSIVRDLLKPIYYHKAIDCDFSVRSLTPLLEQEFYDKRLFLISDPENEKEYSVVFRGILELFSKVIINLSNNRDRRITILCDEAASLGRLESILNDLPERARSKGANLLVGLQSFSQWAEIFGERRMDAILANISTKVILKSIDNFTDDYICKHIGEGEYEVERESLNEDSKGNTSASIEKRSVLTPSDLSTLESSHAFIAIGKYVTKVYFGVPKLQDKLSLETHKDMIDILPCDFKEKKMSLDSERKIKVIEGAIKLKKTTNKLVTPENVAIFAQMSVVKVTEYIKAIIEEKAQIDRAKESLAQLNEFNKSALSNKTFYLLSIQKITGLEDLKLIELYLSINDIFPEEKPKAESKEIEKAVDITPVVEEAQEDKETKSIFEEPEEEKVFEEEDEPPYDELMGFSPEPEEDLPFN